jgi:hypothetical protein
MIMKTLEHTEFLRWRLCYGFGSQWGDSNLSQVWVFEDPNHAVYKYPREVAETDKVNQGEWNMLELRVLARVRR